MRRQLTLNWAKALVESNYHFVAIGGEQAESGPLIAVSNHTNGMVDAPILIRAARRPLRFLVKHELVRMPLLGWMVRGTGAVPVYRRKDNVPTSWNDGVFDEIHRSLGAGDAIGVFPEGTSHLEAGIRPLRTGVARIALGAEETAGWSLGLRILPIGIHYEERAAFGARVLAVVGPALDVKPFSTQHAQAPWDTALELTAKIHEALEGVRVELVEKEAAPLIGVVLDELQAGTLTPSQAPEALRLLVDGWRALSESDPDLARAHWQRLEELRAPRAPRGVGLWLERGLFACATLLWSLPLLVARLLSVFLPLPSDKRATIRLLAASILFPLWTILLPWLVGARFGGGWGSVTLLVLGLSAWGAWSRARARYTRALPPSLGEERARIVRALRGTEAASRVEGDPPTGSS